MRRAFLVRCALRDHVAAVVSLCDGKTCIESSMVLLVAARQGHRHCRHAEGPSFSHVHIVFSPQRRNLTAEREWSRSMIYCLVCSLEHLCRESCLCSVACSSHFAYGAGLAILVLANIHLILLRIYRENALNGNFQRAHCIV